MQAMFGWSRCRQAQVSRETEMLLSYAAVVRAMKFADGDVKTNAAVDDGDECCRSPAVAVDCPVIGNNVER
jgi:hypothetical protein